MIDFDRIEESTKALRDQFAKASPFPFLVLDGLFDPDELASAVEAWPHESPDWKGYQREKRGLMTREAIPSGLLAVIDELNSERFVRWLASISRVKRLQADDSMAGGGLHEVGPGGALGMHIDFNRLDHLYRRVNCLLYLNRDWPAEWGGALELRDCPKDPGITKTIAPTFNRLVIFEASEHSWHGHPLPLQCPNKASRKSIAAYYYSDTPHPSYKEKHSTIYKGRKVKG